MRKLLIALLIVWTLFYWVDYSWLNNMHFHLDLQDVHLQAGEWFFGLLALIAVFMLLAAIMATGIIVLFIAGVVAAVASFAALGLSIFWPVVMGVGVYLLCRDNRVAT
ncbi:hypothetical protein [Alteromonas flava]|uniref:hypothetical protein n=1 Tax=Alteromonas flava TaxID=2048003 RepID=UPI000C2950F6|nr:hypothetical protein [Alteromonas flava]